MAQLIANERVDDIPLLLSQMEKLKLSELANEHFKQGHFILNLGNEFSGVQLP